MARNGSLANSAPGTAAARLPKAQNNTDGRWHKLRAAPQHRGSILDARPLIADAQFARPYVYTPHQWSAKSTDQRNGDDSRCSIKRRREDATAHTHSEEVHSKAQLDTVRGADAQPASSTEAPVLPSTEPEAQPSTAQEAASRGVPVFVMLPLDTVCVQYDEDGSSRSYVQNADKLQDSLHKMRNAGVTGVMVDVWWGIVEREAPNTYDFAAYATLLSFIAEAGLQLQAVMSFHAAGCNVGDTCSVALPAWVHEIGDAQPDIFYTDRHGYRNRESLSLGCSHEAVLGGRTPLHAYEGVVRTFCDRFSHLIGTTVTEITVGCGPAGEARYPAYPEGDRRWRFPGVGEFQCYDAFMLKRLQRDAEAAGHPEWGYGGPHDAGCYNSKAEETCFFHPTHGRWGSDYGQWFLQWYTGLLTAHVRDVLAAAQRGAAQARHRPQAKLGIKLSGVHWSYCHRSHAAEATAGYFNTFGRNGYAPLFEVAREFGAVVSFTCVEMRDCEHPPDAVSSPEALLRQVSATARDLGVPLTGENALQRYDCDGLHRMRDAARADGLGGLHQITFLRMGPPMFAHWDAFCSLVRELAAVPRTAATV